jgi:DNA-binding IclR family transcriptional regulator
VGSCQLQLGEAEEVGLLKHALVLEGETSEAEWEEIEEAARTITRAGWWIDQRSSEPGDLTELLEAATGADRPTENPHF